MGNKKITISVPEDLLEAIRTSAGARGLSAYVTEALRRQQELDRTRELLEWLEDEYGPITDEEHAAAERELADLRAEHARRRAQRRDARPNPAE
ncbi:CopG family transcriptional regulator [Pseudofrankia asymbiotica]|uniref:CopG family transcriptional regulator n=1 Tax=Pseudofrankia asymbiotica TaxID=1834516 RepID=A0A1V2I3U9_9ACTN|nr:CopG family transcriptional regulator [Pseudofrankia asymbiotica]ONH24627.1 CopG family transcriptional regulator [Pseudofrankia asymbiotica]